MVTAPHRLPYRGSAPKGLRNPVQPEWQSDYGTICRCRRPTVRPASAAIMRSLLSPIASPREESPAGISDGARRLPATVAASLHWLRGLGQQANACKARQRPLPGSVHGIGTEAVRGMGYECHSGAGAIPCHPLYSPTFGASGVIPVWSPPNRKTPDRFHRYLVQSLKRCYGRRSPSPEAYHRPPWTVSGIGYVNFTPGRALATCSNG
jgi:hypothetical protein